MKIEDLTTCQVLVQYNFLESDADAATYFTGLSDDVKAGDLSSTGGRQQLGGEDADGGCFAGAVGSKQCVDLIAVNSEIHTAQRGDRCAVAAWIFLDEILGADGVGWLHGHGFQLHSGAPERLENMGDARNPKAQEEAGGGKA